MDSKQIEAEFLQGLDDDLGALGLLGEHGLTKKPQKAVGAAGMPKRAIFNEFGAIEESKLYMSMTFFSFFKKLQVSSSKSIDLQNLTVTQCFLVCSVAVKQIHHEKPTLKSMAYNFSMSAEDLMAQITPISVVCLNETKDNSRNAQKTPADHALIYISHPANALDSPTLSLTETGKKLMESIVSTKIFRT